MSSESCSSTFGCHHHHNHHHHHHHHHHHLFSCICAAAAQVLHRLCPVLTEWLSHGVMCPCHRRESSHSSDDL
ncbi:hypothetical protein D4764_10G0005060 [Takifugu flavidus]|uniref:Uncharacterized protein n=1 Tax=Takifugu flavidus TaxID=433684 RepID=A0A5C6PKR5_9TELE|nr:hypothetical protein D4764_10G0005060 [Takifugu flavidus]